MKPYRPLLFRELSVRLPGVSVRRLRLNRHLPEAERVGEHAHAHSQILFYLSGGGILSTGGDQFEIGPRSLIFLPPQVRHAFRETRVRKPLCLVIDLDWRGARRWKVKMERLSSSDAGIVRAELSSLTRLSEPDQSGQRLLVSASVLKILDTLMRGLRVLKEVRREKSVLVHRVDRYLWQSAFPLPKVKQMAEDLGYQVDYLNRVFKRSTGRTLKEYSDLFLLEKAKRLLGECRHIGDVCDALGFADQNYFSRWFKKQTGLQPRQMLRIRQG